MKPTRQSLIRSLFKDYIKMYASRNDLLTGCFSDNFSGYASGGDFIVGDKESWVAITRQDFSQVPGKIRIEMLDLLMQDLSDDIVVATALFHIHLPVPEQTLSSEAVRLTLVFRQECDTWKIVHSGISVPYYLVQEGEVYPLKRLYERNHGRNLLLKERELALEEATRKLDALHQMSYQIRVYLEPRLAVDPDIDMTAREFHCSRRTLTRRLKEEGTSFLKIKDRLRRSIALQLLATNQLSVDAISVKIGFADLASFYRSFKKWTGTTPLAYQRLSD